ncbi:hypothetical protein SUGI_0439580 [Cryptomeria japonica]|nr:hypothetical protein SUGI_0439580 [Cryptomeria japonica]
MLVHQYCWTKWHYIKKQVEGTSKLLERFKAQQLKECDCDGKTTLHYVTQIENGDDALVIAKSLLNKCESDELRSRFLFSSAVGIGSANMMRELLAKGANMAFI